MGEFTSLYPEKHLREYLKARKLSTAMLDFAEYFHLLRVERHPNYDVLLLVALPNGHSAHVPLWALTEEAQTRLQLCPRIAVAK